MATILQLRMKPRNLANRTSSMQEFIRNHANTTASLDWIVSTLVAAGFTRDQISDALKAFIDSKELSTTDNQGEYHGN